MIQIKAWLWCDVMLQNTSADQICENITLSTVVCGTCFAETDTILVFRIFYGSIQRRNPPCNAEDNLRARLVVIEAWFRGY